MNRSTHNNIYNKVNQRVAVFIDTQNLYHSARKLYNSKVNFQAVLEDAVNNRQLVRAIAYAITTNTQEEKAFLDALTNLGIELKIKPLQVYHDGSMKADWDIGLAIDTVSIAQKVDTVVIVSGDGDFIPLVNYLQTSCGCLVEIMSFGQSTSQKIKEVADHFYDLSHDADKYVLRNKRSVIINRNGPRKKPRSSNSIPREAI